MSHPLTDAKRLHAIRAHCQSLGHQLTPFYFETYHEIDGAAQIACCQKCGCRVTFGRAEDNPSALSHHCDGDKLRAIESRAWLVGAAPRLLVPRLTAAVAELPAELQRYFDPGDFDAAAQCLDSEDGVWRLEWNLRAWPDEPISQNNRQSAIGLVELKRRVEEHDLLPARYIGERDNPNISEDPQHWLVQPLEPGTEGVAYRLPDCQWMFRRRQGVTGYFVSYDDLDFEPHIRHAAEAILDRPESQISMLTAGSDLDPAVTGEWSL